MDAAFADHFRRALEECDIATIRKLWAHVAPGMPQPATDFEALAALHHARTQAASIALKQRAWSHRWLLDHDLPSGLPDPLKPRAERLYPQVVSAVGISVNVYRSKRVAERVGEIRQAMSDAVAGAYADHNTEPGFVKARMMEARNKVLKS
jgi:hypothetical protein